MTVLGEGKKTAPMGDWPKPLLPDAVKIYIFPLTARFLPGSPFYPIGGINPASGDAWVCAWVAGCV